MIRKSTVIAAVAILLSLFVHFLGLSFTSTIQPKRIPLETGSETVAMGNTFEDIAEAPTEPEPPEPAPVPDPPVETSPEPDQAETPTSEALVASPNPRPDTINPSEVEESTVIEPTTAEPAPPVETNVTSQPVTPPVSPETAADAPEGEPNAGTDPIIARAVEPVRQPPISPVPQSPLTLPVIPVPEAAAIPVIPLESDAITPARPEMILETVPDETEVVDAEDEPDSTELAVISSLRPKLSPRRSSPERSGLPEGSTNSDEFRIPQSALIESPLAVYKLDGIDLFASKNKSQRARSGGGGNSDVSNYAGRVLVHLNRAPTVRVKAQGFARVVFRIKPDGTLGSIDIAESTGWEEINRAAEAQVRNAAPFPLPPNGASREMVFVYRSN